MKVVHIQGVDLKPAKAEKPKKPTLDERARAMAEKLNHKYDKAAELFFKKLSGKK